MDTKKKNVRLKVARVEADMKDRKGRLVPINQVSDYDLAMFLSLPKKSSS